MIHPAKVPAPAPAPRPAPAPAPVPVPAGGGRLPPPPAPPPAVPPPGAPDPLERQRLALARAYQASPAAEPEQSAEELWQKVVKASAADEHPHLLMQALCKSAQPLRLLKHSLAVRVSPELVGPLLFQPWGGLPFADWLEHNLSALSGQPMALGLEPTYQLSPCPPDTERLSLTQWAGRGLQLLEANPTTLGAVYRRVFGINPRKPKQTCTYSRRELQLLGLLL